MQPRYICLYLQVHLIAMNSKCQSLRPTPTLPTPTPQCSSSDVMWRSRPLRRCFALVPLCLWSLDNLSLRRDEVFLAFFHVFVSTYKSVFTSEGVSIFLVTEQVAHHIFDAVRRKRRHWKHSSCWMLELEHRLSKVHVHTYLSWIILSSNANLNLLSKVENGQFILVKIWNLHVMRKI